MKSVAFLKQFVNRNPRNLERLRLQAKPSGWDFEKNRDAKNYLYRIDFMPSKRNTSAYVVHYQDGIVLSANTLEKGVSSQLYSFSDANAACNIARLLAHRCRMVGITRCAPGMGFGPEEDSSEQTSKRSAMFFETLREEGIEFHELEAIPHTHLNDPDLTWEPFIFKHTREDKLDDLDLSLTPGKGRI